MELNNVKVGFNKHLKNWRNLLDRAFEANNKKWSFSIEDYYTVSILFENIQDKIEFHWLA